MPDAPSTDDPEGDRSRLPSDPDTLQRWVERITRRYLDAKEERDHARKALCAAQQENERLRNELKELKEANAAGREADTVERMAERMARAVADAARRGRRWNTGADLKRWLVQEFGLKATTKKDREASERAVERNLDRIGVWERSGTKGHTGNSVRKTVENCLKRAGFSI